MTDTANTDPVVDGLNAAMAEVQAELDELHQGRTALLRKVPSDPKGVALELQSSATRIRELNAKLETWAAALEVHQKDQAAANETARRDAAKDLLALVSEMPKERIALAMATDQAMAATLEAWRAYRSNGEQTWKHASVALLALHHDDQDWGKYLDANLRHSGPCMGNGSAAIATLGRFIHQLVAIVGGDAHHALNDPRLAYSVGPRDLVDVATEHAQHIAIHFAPTAE